MVTPKKSKGNTEIVVTPDAVSNGKSANISAMKLLAGGGEKVVSYVLMVYV